MGLGCWGCTTVHAAASLEFRGLGVQGLLLGLEFRALLVSKSNHLEGQEDLVSRLILGITKVTIGVIGVINLQMKKKASGLCNYRVCSKDQLQVLAQRYNSVSVVP